MKKLLAGLLSLIFAAGCLCSCSVKGGNLYKYRNPDKYSVGNTEFSGKITKLDVEWISGSVNIIAAGESVAIKETAPDPLEEKHQLRWWLDGETLRIRFVKNEALSLSKVTLPKDLTLTLPAETVLDEIEIYSVSADVSVEADSKEYEISTVSGDLDIISSAGNTVRAETVSGTLSISAAKLVSAALNSVSGDLTLRSEVLPERIEFNSISGNTEIFLPENASFSVNAGSVSGNFTSDFPFTKSGKYLISGDGLCKITASSVSGDISIKKN